MRLEAYIDPDRRWGSWHLSRAASPCALYNVRHGYAEVNLHELTSVEMLRTRVSMIADKSWCSDQEFSSLSSGLATTIGYSVEVQRVAPHAHAGMAGIMECLMSGQSVPRVWIRDARTNPLRPDIYRRLRKTIPRRRMG